MEMADDNTGVAMYDCNGGAPLVTKVHSSTAQVYIIYRISKCLVNGVKCDTELRRYDGRSRSILYRSTTIVARAGEVL